MSGGRDRSWPRVLLVHSYYASAQPSGENNQVESQLAALRRAGCQVDLAARRTEELAGSPWYPVRAALTTAFGRGWDPSAYVRRLDPDLVHVHNLFPNIGRRWLDSLRVPYVVSAHNYRPLCANATLFRDGQMCTACFSGPAPGLLHGCYRGSRLATAPLTVGQAGLRRVMTDRPARIIVLSDLQRDLYVRAGVPAAKLAVVPNFVPDTLDPGAGPGGEGWLFVGRLEHQKGVDSVLAAWPDEIALTIVGTGPLAGDAARVARDRAITLLGSRSRTQVVDMMRRARGVVFPSAWPDPFGLVHAEAWAAGTPVLATRPSAAADVIATHGGGLAVESLSPDLVRRAHAEFRHLRAVSRALFESRYTESAHLDLLAAEYSSVLG